MDDPWVTYGRALGFDPLSFLNRDFMRLNSGFDMLKIDDATT